MAASSASRKRETLHSLCLPQPALRKIYETVANDTKKSTGERDREILALFGKPPYAFAGAGSYSNEAKPRGRGRNFVASPYKEFGKSRYYGLTRRIALMDSLRTGFAAVERMIRTDYCAFAGPWKVQDGIDSSDFTIWLKYEGEEPGGELVRMERSRRSLWSGKIAFATRSKKTPAEKVKRLEAVALLSGKRLAIERKTVVRVGDTTAALATEERFSIRVVEVYMPSKLSTAATFGMTVENLGRIEE